MMVPDLLVARSPLRATMGTAAKLRLAVTDSLYVCVGVLPVNSREVKLKCISR